MLCLWSRLRSRGAGLFCSWRGVCSCCCCCIRGCLRGCACRVHLPCVPCRAIQAAGGHDAAMRAVPTRPVQRGTRHCRVLTLPPRHSLRHDQRFYRLRSLRPEQRLHGERHRTLHVQCPQHGARVCGAPACCCIIKASVWAVGRESRRQYLKGTSCRCFRGRWLPLPVRVWQWAAGAWRKV